LLTKLSPPIPNPPLQQRTLEWRGLSGYLNVKQMAVRKSPLLHVFYGGEGGGEEG